MPENKPFVSIIIPCRNEEKWIGKCIESVLNNDYPKDKIEILVADGQSTDRTVERASQYQAQYPFIKILQNEKRIFPAAVNLGYKNSCGDFIIILGAHAEYATNYISGCVEAALQHNVENAGGVLEQIWPRQNFVGTGITTVLSSRFGIGNALFRIGVDKPMLVTTVFGGCYRRSVFEQIGLFNEDLISSSDMDFNTRLKKAGGKTLITPEVRAYYHFAETNYVQFIKNYYRNGFWAIYPLKFVDYLPVSFRHLIPLFFLGSILGSVILTIIQPLFCYLLIATVGLHLLTGILFSIPHCKKNLLNILLLPFLFLSLHLAYGTGSTIALIKTIISPRFYKMHLMKEKKH